MNDQNIKILKEEEPDEDPSPMENQNKLSQYPFHQFCHQPYPPNPLEHYLESLNKKNINDGYQAPPYLGYNFEDQNDRYPSYFDDFKSNYIEGLDFQHFMPMQHPWYLGNNNYIDKVKHEQPNQHRFWSQDIKDQFSNEFGYFHQDFKPLQIKQQANEAIYKNINYDVCKFIETSQANKDQKKSYRKMRVEAYLKKKKKRSFEKKIIYKCRKLVADNRVRYKGKFISLKQAKKILGIQDDKECLASEIKQLLDNMKQEVKNQPTQPIKQQNNDL